MRHSPSVLEAGEDAPAPAPVSTSASASISSSPPPHDRKRRRLSPSARTAQPKQQSIHNLLTTQSSASTSLPTSASSDLLSTHRQQPHTKSQSAMYSFSSKFGGGVDLSNPPQNRRPNNRLQKGFQPKNGTTKLTVKTLKPQPSWDANKYFEQTWAQLDQALTTIFAQSPINFSIEDMYRGVENLCRQKRAEEINAKLIARCRSHVNDTLKSSLLSKQRQSNVQVLDDVLKAWAAWNSQMTHIRCIFYYMDRSYLLQSSKHSLQDVAVKIFRDSIFQDPTLKPRIIDGACELISADRTSKDLDRSLLRNAISMFHDLGTYTTSFEPRMLAHSQQYVVEWAEQTSSEKRLPEYVNAAVAFMTNEVDRCELFGLDQSTRRDLLALLEDHVIERKLDYLTGQDDIADLLDEYAVKDLEQLHALLQRKRLGSKIRPAFERWISDTGTQIVFDDKAQEQMVVRLLSLKTRLDNIWRTSFHRSEELGHALRESFETFINKTKKGDATHGTDNSKPGEMIAKYIDQLLRGGAKAIPTQLTAAVRHQTSTKDEEDNEGAMDEDSEVNSQLDQVLDLFRFVHGKAVFEAFYKKDLARRLLMGRSASADAERSMLARLKTECGAGFTQNLEQMFKDVELAREEMSSYKSRMEERQERPKVDLNVNVLSAAAWPTYPDVPVRVPADIKAAIDEYEKHYKSKHSGRKLEWKHSLAHCQMKAKFSKGTKELVVSSFQAIVLLLFNGLDKDQALTYEFVKAESGLPEAEVKRTLQSLACAKLRPLTKHPKGREINDTDTFTVDPNFWHEKYRVKINQVQLKETKEENKETHERVAADRNFECQAAVVRIMKSRKTIGHSELIAEVITATRSRGVLNVADIKKNIDRLIEKDYMEREEGNMYSYIA